MDYQNFPGAGDDSNNESVEVLRERLNTMKRLMAERTAQQQKNPASTEEIWSTHRPHRPPSMINGNILGMCFAGALLVIISVSVYAFYSLYTAVLRKFPSNHEEL
ncbi:uncharacterized protein LOC135948965 [Calliphora vicina]|uniref:uncharacterized protein LOC135948965 n=1 Tax=Calliphora vicina TaxID=7373 RepID=UPI00325A4584